MYGLSAFATSKFCIFLPTSECLQKTLTKKGLHFIKVNTKVRINLDLAPVLKLNSSIYL